MTTTISKKADASPQSKNEASPKPDKPPVIALDQLAREMKVSPRDARMLLRLAAKQTKLYPTLGKDHVARQPWQWTPGSKGLEEARKALATAQTA
jgi:hypothetical protein